MKKLFSILSMFAFTILAYLVLPLMPALATDFEVGTQFGITHLTTENETSITFTRIPSGAFVDLGVSPTSLYTTWFPNNQFAIGPEFSFGSFTLEDEDFSLFYLGGRAAYFFNSHLGSSPYFLGRVSLTLLGGEIPIFSDEDALTGFGVGIGYQWRIDSAFVLRTEIQYQRVLVEEESFDAFSFLIGIGTRFGNNKNTEPKNGF